MIILIGPENRIVTGQSLAFHTFCEKVCDRSIDEKNNYNIGGKGSDKYKKICYPVYSGSRFSYLFKTIKFIFKFISCLVFNLFSVKKIYFTSSRTKIGFCRDFIVFIFSKIFRKKIVNHLHGADFLEFRNSSTRAWKFFIDFMYRKIDMSIVLSPSMAEQYSIYPSMDIAVVPNFSQQFRDRIEVFDNSRELNVLFLSNLMYSKGIIYLIKAVIKAHDSGFPIRLVIAGNYVSDNIESVISNLIGGHEYIEYIGPVSGEKKWKIFEKSDVFCLPSFYISEAQPISIIEGMACSCIIMTTHHNYMDDFTNINGTLYLDKKSSQSIFLQLKKIFSGDLDLEKMKKSNFYFAKKNFYLENYIYNLRILLEN